MQVENIVAAEYELEHLLLEGHCFDVSSGQPPRGLQFTLGTASEPVIVDTIVMANLVSCHFDLQAYYLAGQRLTAEICYNNTFATLFFFHLVSVGLLSAEG